MTKLRERYDWIVVGDSIGALISGWLVSRLGLSVLFLNHAHAPRARLIEGGQYLDLEANRLVGFPPIGSEGILGILADELVQARKGQNVFSPLNLEVVFPGFRARAFADPVRLTSELKREWGSDEVRIRSAVEWLDELAQKTRQTWLGYPKTLTLIPSTEPEKKKWFSALPQKLPGSELFKKALSNLNFERSSFLKNDPRVRRFFEGWSMALGFESTTWNAKDASRFLGLGLAGWASQYQGGMSACRRDLIESAVRRGAHAPAENECRRIFLSEGRVVGVQVASRAAAISTSGVSLGCTFSQAKKLFNGTLPRSVRRLGRGTRPLGWRYTVALTVPKQAIPSGFPSFWIWAEAGAPGLEIERVTSAERGLDDREHEVIFLRTVLDYRDETLDPKYQHQTSARMFRQLLELCPFLEFHLTQIFPDFRAGQSTEETEVYGFESLDAIPSSLLVYDSDEAGSEPEPTGIEGLFLGTDEYDSRWAGFGHLRAALDSATWIAHRSGLPGPLGTIANPAGT